MKGGEVKTRLNDCWLPAIMAINDFMHFSRFLSQLLFSIVLCFSWTVVAADEALSVLPIPRSVTQKEGRFVLNRETVIAGNLGEALHLAEVLRRGTGLPLSIVETAPETNSISLVMDPGLKGSVGLEGYRLSVSAGKVKIVAAGEAGLFYGGVTLCQLLPPAVWKSHSVSRINDWSVPCAEIEDFPEHAWRGMLLDVARHFFPPEFVKKFIDDMAIHKLNMLHLHLSDDQGWRVEIHRYPLLTEVGSKRAESPKAGDRNSGDGVPYGPFFYTQDQLKDLIQYARVRHVEIVPEIDMPGHFVAALAGYPQYSCKGGAIAVSTRWPRKKDVLCLGNDEAVEFAKNILGEIVEIFPSKFIHVGGDEVIMDRWKECPRCQARMKALGFSDEHQLHSWFNHQLEVFLEKHGRRLVGWDEILDGGTGKNSVIMCWRGMDAGAAACTEGRDVVMCPSMYYYFDSAQSKDPGEPEAARKVIPLEKTFALDPVPINVPEENRSHILGVEGCLWSEFLRTPAGVEYAAFPRACALAELGWSPESRRGDFASFSKRLSHHLERLKSMGVNYRNPRQ